MKKGLKYIKYIILGLLILLVAAALLIQLPSIQTKLTNKINQSLSEKLGNQISVEEVDIDFFNQVDLAGVYIEDLQGDTIAYIESLEVKTSLLGLIKNELIITEATLRGADIQLKKDLANGEYNFQFLIDAFTPTDSTSSKTSLAFDLEELELENTHFKLQDEGSDLDILLTDGTLDLDELDIDRKKIIADDLFLADAQVSYVYTATTQPSNNNLKFPSLSWQIEIANLKTEQVDVTIKEKNSGSNSSIIAYDDLYLSELNLEAQSLKVDSTIISGEIHHLALKEKSGFQLDSLNLDFQVTQQGINLSRISIETPQSKISSSTFLSYKEFADLKNIKAINIKSTFDKSNISIKDLRYFSDLFSSKSFTSISAQENVILDGELIGDVRNLQFKNVTLRIPDIINTRLNGKLTNILNKDNLGFDMNVEELKTSSTKLSDILPKETLPSSLNTFGEVDLSGNFFGNLQSFEVEDFDFNSSADTEAKFSGKITDALNPELLKLDLKIEKLNTHLNDLKGFIKGDLPPAIAEAGSINYIGNFIGTLKEFELGGKLKTDIGSAETDVALRFDNNYTGASYSGAIQLQDFDLGSVLKNDDFGNVSLSIDADGAGLDIKNMNSEMNMKVASLMYKDVVYENFTFSGIVDQKKINGDFKISNPNAVAEFKGLLDLSGEEPEMNFKLDVDTLSLLPMNLSPQDIALSGEVKIKGTGNSLDDFLGNLEINQFNLRKDSLYHHTDTLLLTSTMLKNQNKSINFHTDGIEGNIKGDFRLTQIPIYFKDIVDSYIPVQWLVEESSSVDRSLNTNEIFSVGLEIKDESFLRLFVPKLNHLEDLSLYAYLNSEKESILLNGSILSLEFDKYKSKNIDVFAQNKNNTIENEIRFDSLLGISNLVFPINSLDAVLQKDMFSLSLKVENDSLENILSLGGHLTNEDGMYEFKFNEELQLDSTTWDIAKENSIQFKKDYLFVNALGINKDLQSLIVQSDRGEPLGNTPLNVLVANFDIHELTNLMSMDNDFLYGIIDGNVLVQDVLRGSTTYSGDISAKDILLNQKALGDINLVADKRSDSEILDIGISLNGKENELVGEGTLDLSTNAIDFGTTFINLDITIFDPYLDKIVSDSEGTLNGKLKISGTTEQPIINGKIISNELSTLVNFSNTRYQINKQTVVIEDSRFAFDNLLIQDIENRKAFLNGEINHSRFNNFYYNLSVNTEAFQILNTSAKENPLFYGNLILKADATINGPLNLPNLKVNAISLAGTDFHLSPFAESGAVQQDDYIIFTNNANYDKDSLQNIVYELTNDLPLDLELNLQVDKETEFQFILDPKSGDKLTCFGDANLQVTIAPDGLINVFGLYTVDNGKYNFSYEKIIRKDFGISKGGTVTFQGDPLLARLDVEAAYQTDATPLAIVEDPSSLSDIDVSQLQKRTEVQVALEIEGTIRNPALNFDLGFLESDVQLNPTIDRSLNEIRNNEEILYNQVFGLILFDSFVSSSKTSIAQNTGNIALSSISNLVEDRLNKLASKLIKGIDLIVNVDSYNTDFIKDNSSTSVTEFGLGASKSFFNNRLTFKALGNVDVDNRSKGVALSSIAGDFIIEYKLNSRGNITLEAFRKSDFDVLLEENTNKTGVGISLQKALYLRNKPNR